MAEERESVPIAQSNTTPRPATAALYDPSQSCRMPNSDWAGAWALVVGPVWCVAITLTMWALIIPLAIGVSLFTFFIGHEIFKAWRARPGS